jgi:hypothetical protein
LVFISSLVKPPTINKILDYVTPKSARSLKGRDFLLCKKRDALNCPLDFFVRFDLQVEIKVTCMAN